MKGNFRTMNRIIPMGLILAAAACASGSSVIPANQITPLAAIERARPQDAFMSPDLNRRLDSIMEVGIREHAAPGAALSIGRYGRIVHMKGYGNLDIASNSG